MIEYNLIRTKRKTVALCVRDGAVEVRAPLKMPEHGIERFVASKERWILDKLEKSREQAERREGFQLDYGGTVLYRGKEYPVAAQNGNRVEFDGVAFLIPPGLTSGQIIGCCVQLYRMLAKRVLTEIVMYFAQRMSVMPSAVKINGAKTRWGSCSAQKSLNFSWRLVMADDDVMDYVVVHELAHIKEMNHSVRFWALVEGILPEYRETRTRLRNLQYRLNGEDWE